jgi:hypothetical protein
MCLALGLQWFQKAFSLSLLGTGPLDYFSLEARLVLQALCSKFNAVHQIWPLPSCVTLKKHIPGLCLPLNLSPDLQDELLT